jgi:hypothetical protein
VIKITRRSVAATSWLAAPLLFLRGGSALAQISEMPSAVTSEAEQIALEAYIYGYSLITTEVTRVQMSNVDKIEGAQAPSGLFNNIKRYPPADFRNVSAPNADTLYSFGWLDLSEPQVFSHPDMGKRFYLFEIVDLWMTDLDSPGMRTAGGSAATYLLTGPGWTGTVPAGMKQIKIATRYMVILGRTYADGTDKDYAAVNALQAEYKIVPLSAPGQPFTYKAPPVDPHPGFSMTDKPQSVIGSMSTSAYFNMLAKLMGGAAPPAAKDGPMLARMAKIGLVPGQPFEMSKLNPTTQTALEPLPMTALKHIEASKPTVGVIMNGWGVVKDVGVYGTNYLKRAVVAAYGRPANLDKDAVYPYTEVDSTGRTLSGANKYIVKFPKGKTPPVNGFWSITMYEIDKGWWFVPNALNKFTVSERDNPKPSPDGSLTLYFQNQSPGKDLEANWLPAPKGDFVLMMRMYWPKESSPSILNGSWKPPLVERLA